MKTSQTKPGKQKRALALNDMWQLGLKQPLTGLPKLAAILSGLQRVKTPTQQVRGKRWGAENTIGCLSMLLNISNLKRSAVMNLFTRDESSPRWSSRRFAHISLCRPTSSWGICWWSSASWWTGQSAGSGRQTALPRSRWRCCRHTHTHTQEIKEDI